MTTVETAATPGGVVVVSRNKEKARKLPMSDDECYGDNGTARASKKQRGDAGDTNGKIHAAADDRSAGVQKASKVSFSALS